MCYERDTLGIKEFGVESDTKVTNMGAPWDDCVGNGRGWEEGTAFVEKYGFCFVNVNTQFPFGVISKNR